MKQGFTFLFLCCFMLAGCGLLRFNGQINNSGYLSLKPWTKELLKPYEASASAGYYFEDNAVYEVGITDLEKICQCADTILLRFWVASCSGVNKSIPQYIDVVKQNNIRLYLLMRDYNIPQIRYQNNRHPLLAKVYVLKYADFTDNQQTITDRYKKTLERISGQHFDNLPHKIILYKKKVLAINQQADRFLLANR